MAHLIGILLVLAVSAFAAALRLDRDRAFYPVVMMVIALYYVLFAVMGGSTRTVVVGSLIATAFVAAASLGFRRILWLVAAALGAHGVMDVFHARLVSNPGVPAWWSAWCMAYDLAAAAVLALLLLRAAPASRPVTALPETAP
jgi:hypothetical protein